MIATMEGSENDPNHGTGVGCGHRETNGCWEGPLDGHQSSIIIMGDWRRAYVGGTCDDVDG